MKLEGYLKKPGKGKYWGVEIPSLGIYTQGTSKKECYSMAQEAIELLLEESDCKVTVEPGKGLEFYISSKTMAPIISLILQRKRFEAGVTIMEVARRMGSHSPTAYARYEQGLAKPSLDKLDQILTAIDASLEPILKIE